MAYIAKGKIFVYGSYCYVLSESFSLFTVCFPLPYFVVMSFISFQKTSLPALVFPVLVIVFPALIVSTCVPLPCVLVVCVSLCPLSVRLVMFPWFNALVLE